MARKPVIFAKGAQERKSKDFYEQHAAPSPSGMRRDVFYIPGYSDKRHDIEAEGRIPELEMPFKFKWERVTKLDNSADAYAILAAEDMGYRFVCGERDDSGEWRFPDLDATGCGLPPGARINAEGHLRIGDTALMINTDAARIRENFLTPIRESKARKGASPQQPGIQEYERDEEEVQGPWSYKG